ncbi:hypothetical protein EVAR_81576_1 [Eumeta japonica]|uniref:Uncharacterized protein n=1 Tax=Eumeta variegata TaxID=151549 RepID=A0A4C1UZZ3_EUMVA|nr:hypothetical protein EVAR_81576_1 [Eumeta japonica]
MRLRPPVTLRRRSVTICVQSARTFPKGTAAMAADSRSPPKLRSSNDAFPPFVSLFLLDFLRRRAFRETNAQTPKMPKFSSREWRFNKSPQNSEVSRRQFPSRLKRVPPHKARPAAAARRAARPRQVPSRRGLQTARLRGARRQVTPPRPLARSRLLICQAACFRIAPRFLLTPIPAGLTRAIFRNSSPTPCTFPIAFSKDRRLFINAPVDEIRKELKRIQPRVRSLINRVLQAGERAVLLVLNYLSARNKFTIGGAIFQGPSNKNAATLRFSLNTLREVEALTPFYFTILNSLRDTLAKKKKASAIVEGFLPKLKREDEFFK